MAAASSSSSSSSYLSNYNCNSNNVDLWAWILSLPPLHEWKTNFMSTCICSSASNNLSSRTILSTPPTSLNLRVSKLSPNNLISLSIDLVGIKFPNNISLWTSKPIKLEAALSSNSQLVGGGDESAIKSLLVNIIQDVLGYGPYGQNKSNNINPSYGSTYNNYHLTLIRIPSYYKLKPNPNPNYPRSSSSSETEYYYSLKGIFNLALLVLIFLVSIYELAPLDLRSNCLNVLKDRFVSYESRESSRHLMRMLGPNLEEQWMRSLNLALTNWKVELKAANQSIKCDYPLFCFGYSTYGMWRVHVYCPVIAMEVENSSGSADEELMFSLNYHQLEAVIQLNYKVVVGEKWIDLMVNIDNVRLDVVQLVSDKLLAEQGAGATEKHFPSRISIQLTPSQLHTHSVLSVSVSKSSDNPIREIELEKTIEGSFEPPTNLFPALKVSAGETTTTTLKPWKFEESAVGYSGNLSWFLHDVGDGREVFSSKPPMMAIFHPKSWFRNRYSNANRPFTRKGGVVFARDEYGETVRWKIDRRAMGTTMDWEVKGCIGVTYWPNKHRTLYNDTRRAEFRDALHLTLN